jgi:predicted ATPase/DNA-binding SARP family transcriptional activator
MEQLDVRILGPLEVVSGGSGLALGGQKQRAVLAILATRAGTAVSSDQLIELLWDESPPATAATTVQVYVSRLRKLLGANRIETSGAGYVLRVEADELDAHRFRRLASQKRAAEALALWRGPALADFAYETWAQPEAGRLEEERLACLEERIDADLEAGGHAGLVGELEVLVAEHPLRERLRGQLMLALYRAGRQAEALDAYQRARSALVEELGIEPGQELQELNRRILQQDVGPARRTAKSELPAGTVTLLATDIAGSTELLAELGSEAYGAALTEHRGVLREAFTAHAGVEVDTQGDAFLVAFARASDAAAAALEAQGGLTEGAIRVRMGLHSGEPLLTDEGYVGMDVHQAARVMSAGHGGQVLVSHATKALLDDSVPVRNLGSHRLKDLTAPQPLYQLGDGDFPPLNALHQTNLPVQPTPLVGRETELEEVSRLLHESQLVTLTGAGGSGKTRLALQAVAEAVDEFEHGVWWVSLAPVRDPELVEPTIAQVVGAKDRLTQWARGMETLLLLDNCEHLLDGVAGVVSGLAGASDVRVLATSRERIGIAAEQEYPVPTLTPDEAVALFVARARRSTPAFQPDEHVGTICERLDGLPLAVELAAARIAVLSPDQILERLARSLDLLTAGARDAPERQRTLRATVEWSHNLLSLDEQQLFARLAVFAGGCTLEAAEHVVGADLDALQSLVEKSLLRHTGARYWMLETIREYAEERLNAMEDADALRTRHLDHFVAFAEEAQTGMWTAAQERWLGLTSDEKANFRAAIDWAGDHDSTLALRLCSALAWFWHHGSDVQGGRRRLAFALDRARDAPAGLRAAALDGACIVSHACGEFAAERVYATEQLALADELNDPTARARGLSNLAIVKAAEGADLDLALQLLRESVDLARTASDRWVLTISTLNLGWVALANRDYQFAIEALEESLALSQAEGDRVIRMHILFNLGQALLKDGDPVRAGAIFEECMRMSRDVDFADGLVYSLVGLAGVAVQEGSGERAAQLLGAAEAGRVELGIAFEPGDQEMFDDIAADVILLLGAEAADAESRAGTDMGLEEAVDYALSLD